MKKVGIAVITAVLVAPSLLRAQPVTDGNRTALRFGAGLSYVEMGKVNDAIDVIFEGIPIVQGQKSLHLSIDFRGELVIPLSGDLAVAPAFEVQIAPKIYKLISSYGYSTSELTILAYNISPGVMLHLTPRVSETTDFELCGGPFVHLAGITIDGGGLSESEEGSGLGFRGEMAFVYYWSGRASTALRFGAVARYAKIKVGRDWGELDFSGAGLFASFHFPI